MQGVSNLLWAYAKMGVNPLSGQLFRSAVTHARSKLDKCANLTAPHCPALKKKLVTLCRSAIVSASRN